MRQTVKPVCDAEEVRAVLPAGFVLVNEFEIGLVYQGGSLKRVIWVLTTHVAVCKAAELGFDEGQQFLEGIAIAVAPVNK